MVFALKEISDFKEALPLVDGWKSATTMSGAQCVMTSGALWMLKWLADSWDCPVQVSASPFTNAALTASYRIAHAYS